MSADYAVFPVAVDALPGGISEAIGGQMPDTDLCVYSFATNNIYSPLQEKGQQGFPSHLGQPAGVAGRRVRGRRHHVGHVARWPVTRRPTSTTPSTTRTS